MGNPTYFEALKWASLFVQKSDLEEAATRFLLLERYDWRETDLLVRYQEVMPDAVWHQYQADVQAYVDGMPPQYVIGTAPFYGRTFQVNEAVLIPRPETEELVEWVLTDQQDKANLAILDVGTGSGAIGVTLKAERPDWQVTLSDISEAALQVAKTNASQLGADVELLQGDLLEPVQGRQFDVVVSNPPYISHKEEDLMDQSVLAHEPKLALFADHDGLLIYERLVAAIQQAVIQVTELYLEIGFQQAEAVKTLFETTFPTAEVVVRKDMEQNDRMVRIRFERTHDK